MNPATLEALKQLADAAESPTGQGRHVRLFLLGLFNGQEFPFDLTRLRVIDPDLQVAALRVQAFDMRSGTEIDHWIPGGAERLARWVRLEIHSQP